MAIDRTSGKANNDRNDAQWKRTSGPGLPQMAFHHLIGWETLRDTWNKLLAVADRTTAEKRAAGHEGKLLAPLAKQKGGAAKVEATKARAAKEAPLLKEFLAASTDAGQKRALKCLLAYLQLIGYSEEEAHKVLGNVLEVRTAIAEGADANDVTWRFDRDDLGSRMTWTGWNLVEGPEGNVRSDDDQNGYLFDDFEEALLLTGRTREVDVARKAKELNGHMQSFIKERKVLKEMYLKGTHQKDASGEAAKQLDKSLGAIETLEKHMRAMLAGSAPPANALLCRWDPAMWVYLETPPKKGRPWCKLTTRYAEQRVLAAMAKGIGNVKALSGALSH